MDLIPILIAVPALMAVILPFIREVKIRGIVVYIGAGCVMILSLITLGVDCRRRSDTTSVSKYRIGRSCNDRG